MEPPLPKHPVGNGFNRGYGDMNRPHVSASCLSGESTTDGSSNPLNPHENQSDREAPGFSVTNNQMGPPPKLRNSANISTVQPSSSPHFKTKGTRARTLPSFSPTEKSAVSLSSEAVNTRNLSLLPPHASLDLGGEPRTECSEAQASAPVSSSQGSGGDPRDHSQCPSVPYHIPQWSEPPCYPFYLEVLKEGCIIDQLNICKKGAYMFGRADSCDFVLEHPAISRFHAVIQFKKNGDAYLYDLGSTHGTFVNKCEVTKHNYVELKVGNIIRFGQSSRLYIFQGPKDLMQTDGDFERSEARQEMRDMEASLSRAKREASFGAGISWGMREDAAVEEEDVISELTWQTYKGFLTEKQEKTREKVLKRYEKMTNMKKEIEAIRAKDIAQGGLTQGQQTQIARNEQRISQIMEELENLEETLNDSIQESVGARTGNTSSRPKKKAAAKEEEEFLSDDDEFYDRAKRTSVKNGESDSVETVDTLLGKRDAIAREMEEKMQKIASEKRKLKSEDAHGNGDDILDAYMLSVSSQLVADKALRLENELSALQHELDRIDYLLRFADPTGEAARKHLDPPTVKESESMPLPMMSTSDVSESKPPAGPGKEVTPYALPKPQWLGAVDKTSTAAETAEADHQDAVDGESGFVDYKDRKKVLCIEETGRSVGEPFLPVLENAAAGLIVRKRKAAHPEEAHQTTAEDDVALLLKHERGLYALDDDVDQDLACPLSSSFPDLDSDSSWVPPKGQIGDGRTSRNARYGY